MTQTAAATPASTPAAYPASGAETQANPFTCQVPGADTWVGGEITPWGVQAINANTQAVLAAAATLPKSDVMVCVIDTGINTTACGSDLPPVGTGLRGCSPSTSPASCQYAWDGAAGSQHGNHVLGTASAVRGNGKGIVGVAPSVPSLFCNPFGDQRVSVLVAPQYPPTWACGTMQAASLAVLLLRSSYLTMR